MTSVFLSYARSDDEPFVRRLCDDLKAAGFTVWFDRESLMARGLTFHQEIKDAVRCEVDRIVYVGGPKAASSPFVREEWQLGLEFDHVVVTPILRLGDYNDIPGELALLHCEDFREGANYEQALAKLIANLRQPNPKLGALVAVPSLPPHFLARPELMRRVRDALLVDLQTAHVITSADTSAETHVGMQGMGGIGKSVLAAALARNRQIRQAYPDGIVWIACGQKLTRDDILSRMRDLVGRLGGETGFTSLPQGQGILRELLQAKAVLLILDDVWRAGDAKEFDYLGPRCRMLVTTRDAGILHTLHGERVPVSLFTETEALQLLAAAVGIEASALSPEAHAVVDECGLLPLALALSGGMAKKRGGDFRSVLERLRRADLDKIADRESINPQHETLWRAMQASVEMLTVDRERGIDEQRRFAELAVFSEDETVPEQTVATLWAHTGRYDDLDTEDLLINLAERSLIRLDTQTAADGKILRRISLHNLLHDYAVRTAGEIEVLHRALVEGYQAKCPAGWWTGPNDGYFYHHLREHLIAAGRVSELADLLHDLRWLEAKVVAGLTFDLSFDFRAAIKSLPETDDRHRNLRLLDEALGRDLHFIARHAEDYPQALFQCLWNTAWWYDCPEAAQHYVEPTGGWTRPPHWEHDGLLLCDLLTRWRVDRETTHSGFAWLRTLRPPFIHLGTAQRAIFRGHERLVRSVSYSPDGTRIVSGSYDKTLRVWDAETFECLEVIRGSGDVRAMCGVSQPFWRALQRDLETVVESEIDQQIVAQYSEQLDKIVASPGGRVWAGVIGHHLQILQLEGRPV